MHRLEFESVPLPLLYAAKSSLERYESIKTIIKKQYIAPFDVKTLLELCFEAESFKYIYRIAKKNEKEALRKLHSLSSSKAKNMLSLMVRKYLERIENLCLLV
jgi:geranylgeranyl pyrophosphate synthase